VIAAAWAGRSTCSSRAAVGALLYDDNDRVIASGFNGAPRGFPHCDAVGCNLDADHHCINAIHAEENALLQCAYIGRSTQGLMVFTTHIPCWRCTLRLIQAGVKRVTYMQEYGSKVKETITVLHGFGIPIEQYTGWRSNNELLSKISKIDT
jgi:dCMP deaminase